MKFSLSVLAADKASGDVRSQGGWTEYDDLSVSVSSLQVEAWSTTSAQDKPRSCSSLRSRYAQVHRMR